MKFNQSRIEYIDRKGQEKPEEVYYDELHIVSNDGNEVVIDVGDPMNKEVLDSIDEADKLRTTTGEHTQQSKKKQRAMLLAAGLTAFTFAAGANVFSMAGHASTERATPSDNTPELSAKKIDIMGNSYCHLTIQRPHDTWNYIETYHAEQDVPLGEVLEMVKDANPGVDFETLQEGDKVYVPELTNPLLAGHVGLETNQPIGDVHVN